ncbi:MAG: hypothetical protein HRU01_00535 [Myxococcales bacterium]|nr:hypothetical protein [Myxococcales bacterium]
MSPEGSQSEQTARAPAAAPERWFAIAWAAALLFHHRFSIPWPDHPAGAADLVAVAAAIVTLVRPDLALPLAVLAASQLAGYALSSPVTSNHYTLAAFVNVAVLLALVARRDPKSAFACYAPVGRGIVVLLYFWSFFHKLNEGFLDPGASCAVALSDGIARGLGASAFPLHAGLAIYGTLAIEGLAALLLLTRRGWPIAVLIVLPFHYAIPFSGFAFYIDFSTALLALLTLFIGAERLAAFTSAVWGQRSAAPGSPRLRRLCTGIAVALGFAVASLVSDDRASEVHLGLFSLYAAPLSVFLGGCAVQAWRAREPLALPRFGSGAWLAIPLLFFINGASPYLGLRTENAMAMFSNLRTEGATANHLLMGRSADRTDAQRPVRILASDLASLAAFAGNPDRGLAWFEFWRRVGDARGGTIRYEVAGERFEHRVGSDVPRYRPPTWLVPIAVFRPVELRVPSPCSH